VSDDPIMTTTPSAECGIPFNRQVSLRCSISLLGFSITGKPLLLPPDSHYREGN
jgi:uncharacterized membrane protein YadS